MLTDLADVCRTSGLPVVEVAGWHNRGYAGLSLRDPRGVLWHHTATGRYAFNTSDCPTLGLLVNGRSDLPGPLSQLALGRSGTVYVVAAGLANHAGTGSALGIPLNAGNLYLIGIEMESSGVAPYDWTPAQLAAMPRLGAALERAYLMDQHAEERLQIAHFEYSNAGKIDAAGLPGGMDWLRASINEALEGIGTHSDQIKPIEEDDMFTDSDRETLNKLGPIIGMLNNIASGVNETPNKAASAILDKTVQTPGGGTTSLALQLAYADANRAAFLSDLKAAVAALTPDQVAALVPDEIAEAVVDKIRERFES